ncbi:hypothetical protein FACS1894113_0870 [Alphaproteobacteria bacterium]|nr:hypothetical protein FACS1894113_0870 [Alphaproteobacteria bacterium]
MNKSLEFIAFILSCAIHIGAIVASYFSFGDFFSKKIKDSGYVVFDFVELGPKSKAPIISETEGKPSRTKSKAKEEPKPEPIEKHQVGSDKIEPETVKEQKIEEKKEEQKPKEMKKEEKILSAKPKEKLKPAAKPNEIKKPVGKKKTANKSASNEKAIVNLHKNKKSNASDKNAAEKSFNSLLDSALAKDDNENYGAKAEEVGEVMTATQIDLLRQAIKKCWHFPAGLRNAEDLVVDIKMELDKDGRVKKAEIMNASKMNSDPDFKIAAENAYRAVLDPKCNPLPLPKDKYEEWKELELSFNPKDMF